MGITAKELAKELGISPAAVSMALNGKPGVSTATRRRVLDAAAERGYDMTRITGRHKETKEIYFLVYKKHGVVVTDTAFFSELFEGVNEGCQETGYRLTIRYMYDDGDTLERQIEEVRWSDCSGVILLGTELTAERFEAFRTLKVPIVLLDTYYQDITADYVLINNMQGAYLAASYLIQRTKTQPGYLRSSYPIGNFNERANGFYNAIRAAGMSSSRSVVHRLSPTLEGAFSDMMEILETAHPSTVSPSAMPLSSVSVSAAPPPTAAMSAVKSGAEHPSEGEPDAADGGNGFSDGLTAASVFRSDRMEIAACYFADNDLIAVGAMKAFKAKGYRIPEDVSIIGFDNVPYANVAEPPLTTVHVPKKEMGRTAVLRLGEILEKGETLPMKIEVATRLIKRQSA